MGDAGLLPLIGIYVVWIIVYLFTPDIALRRVRNWRLMAVGDDPKWEMLQAHFDAPAGNSYPLCHAPMSLDTMHYCVPKDTPRDIANALRSFGRTERLELRAQSRLIDIINRLENLP